jgi:hypothetical protein
VTVATTPRHGHTQPNHAIHSEYSKTLNDARLKVLAAREAAIQAVLREVRGHVRDLARNPTSYKKLLQDLLVQVSHQELRVCCVLGLLGLVGALRRAGGWGCRVHLGARVSGTGAAAARSKQPNQATCLLPPLPHHTQAMHKLGEPTALVKARQADTMLVKEVLEPARKQYAGETQGGGS